MGLPLLQEEASAEGPRLSIKGIVSHLTGEKYNKLSVDEDDYSSKTSHGIIENIEMELLSQKKDKSYKELSQIDVVIEEEELDGASIPEKDGAMDKGEVEFGRREGLKERLQKFQQKHMIKIAWGCVTCGILCTAWIAPCFKLLGSEGVDPARRASWRSQVLLMLLSIPALLDYRALSAEQKGWLKEWRTLAQLLLCAFLWFGDLFLWSNALDYTTVSRSSIFANSTSLMILVWCLIRRVPISFMEIGGGIIGFCGMVFAVVGTNLFFRSDAEQKAKSPITGDLLSLASAFCVACYVINANKARAKVTVFIYTFSNTLFLTVALSTASLISEGSKFDTSVDGLFGWTSPHFFLIIGLLSVVAGLIGFNLNNMAIKYVPPLGYSLIGLCDPFISGTYAWLIGADGIPGVFTFLGGLITIGGIVILLVGQEKRKEREKKQKEAAELQDVNSTEKTVNNIESVNNSEKKQTADTEKKQTKNIENQPTNGNQATEDGILHEISLENVEEEGKVEKQSLIGAAPKVVAFSVSEEKLPNR